MLGARSLCPAILVFSFFRRKYRIEAFKEFLVKKSEVNNLYDPFTDFYLKEYAAHRPNVEGNRVEAQDLSNIGTYHCITRDCIKNATNSPGETDQYRPVQSLHGTQQS